MNRLFLIAGALCCLASLAQAQSYPTITNNHAAANAVTAAESYWTQERMDAALPAPMPLATSAVGKIPAVKPTAAGSPGLAGGTGDQTIPQQLQDELTYGAPEPVDGPYPGPYTSWTLTYPQANGSQVPWSTVGVLFFHDPVGGGDFRCSASSTYGGASLDTIWTAGHCVANGGHAQWYDNWMYCPAFNAHGCNAAYGAYGWTTGSTTAAWFYDGALSMDYAELQLTPTSTVVGEHVVQCCGGLGFAWNWGRDQNWMEIGFPAAAPYNGGQMIVTASEHRYDDCIDGFGPCTNSWGSPQTFGASGSPVVLGWSYGGGYINSNVSYLYTNQEFNELQGPYYDTNACNLWKTATGWTGSC